MNNQGMNFFNLGENLSILMRLRFYYAIVFKVIYLYFMPK